MSTRYEDMVERFTKKHGDKFSEQDLDQRFRPFYDSQQRIQVQYVKTINDPKHYGTVGISSGWKPTFILMNNVRARSSSVTLNRNIDITGVNVGGRTYRPYRPPVTGTYRPYRPPVTANNVVTLNDVVCADCGLPGYIVDGLCARCVIKRGLQLNGAPPILDDLDLYNRCIEHGNVNCRLETISQTSRDGTEYLHLATCLKCSRPFHPNTWEDVARRHYCEVCVLQSITDLGGTIIINNSPAAMIDSWLERIRKA